MKIVYKPTDIRAKLAEAYEEVLKGNTVFIKHKRNTFQLTLVQPSIKEQMNNLNKGKV